MNTAPAGGNRRIGPVVPDWTPPPRPGPAEMTGRHVRLERLQPAHGPALHRAFAADDGIWLYLAQGPFPDRIAFADWIAASGASPDPFFYGITDLRHEEPAGVASFMRIMPEHGVIEVGSIAYAPALRATRAATEAMVLMARWAFAQGYRRYEWKCDALNLASRSAAQRLGFSFEGVFRNHMVVKGRSRDTAWFAMTAQDWPAIDAAYAEWLDPSNFDASGQQKKRLADLTAPARVASDPALGA